MWHCWWKLDSERRLLRRAGINLCSLQSISLTETDWMQRSWLRRIRWCGVFHCTSASLLTSFCKADEIPPKAKSSEKDAVNDTTDQMWLYWKDCKHAEGQTHCEVWIPGEWSSPRYLLFPDTDFERISYSVTNPLILKILIWRPSLICETYEVQGVISFSLSMREMVVQGCDGLI